MPLRRIALALLAATALAFSARAAEPLERVAGKLDARTYARLVDIVERNMDKVVRLDLRVVADGKALIAATDANGTAIYVPKGGSELYLPNSAGVRQGQLRIEGAFTVRNGGMNQGVVSYALEALPGAEGAGGRTRKAIELK